MIDRKWAMGRPLLYVLLLLLSGCAANLQGQPMLVGTKDGKPLYAITGFTDWGKVSNSDARYLADWYAHAFCQHNPTIVQLETGPGLSEPIIPSLRWSATYTCDKAQKPS